MANKKSDKLKLLRIMLSISESGVNWQVYDWLGRETKMCYLVELENKEDNFKRKRRVNKEDLLKATTILNEIPSMVGYRIWCLPEDEEIAKEILKRDVIKRGEIIKERALKMIEQLEVLKSQ